MSGTGILQRDTCGPFYGVFHDHYWLYRIGFDIEWEMELQSGYQDVGIAHLPAWAQSPFAGIVGEWRTIRSRWRWFGIPLTRWREKAA